MTQKDPVCNMMIDEKNAQHTSEINGQKIYLYITYMSETQYKHSVVENGIRRSSQANPV